VGCGVVYMGGKEDFDVLNGKGRVLGGGSAEKRGERTIGLFVWCSKHWEAQPR
jgi:hypothetical protein